MIATTTMTQTTTIPAMPPLLKPPEDGFARYEK